MQAQTKAAPRSQTILVVEPDEATRRILDLSLRNAGFAVGIASGFEEAAGKLAPAPDLVIASLDDVGLGLCRQVKEARGELPPAVVLISDPDVESKRRGLEAGADDFVARPIYVQDVVARARALLQRRERERIELAAQRNQPFSSALEDVPLVDLLRAIALNQKSGIARLLDPSGARGEIFFRQGRVVDAEVGRLSGRDAIYRLFCWPSGRLEVEWKSIRRKDTVETSPQDLLMEALHRVDEWRRLIASLPPLDTVLEVDYRLLAERLADIPDEVNRILRLFDGMRTVMQAIDDCGLPDLDAAAAIGKLCRERIVHDVRFPVADEGAIGADMEGWLSDAAGPFRSLPAAERDLFGLVPTVAVASQIRVASALESSSEPSDGFRASRDGLGWATPNLPRPEPLRDGVADAEMQARFTDRLEAEGMPDAVGRPLEIPPMESGPVEGRPTTLPGVGELAELATSASDAAGVEGAGSASLLAAGAGLSAVMEEPSAASLARGPVSTSGEILVRAQPRMKPAADDPPLDAARGPADADLTRAPHARPAQPATPAGSARALDELPPLVEPSVVVSPLVGTEPASPGGPLDSDADLDDEDLRLPTTGRRLLWVGTLLLLPIVGAVVLARSRVVPAESAAHNAAPVPPRAPVVPAPPKGPIEPLPAATRRTGETAPAEPAPDRGERSNATRMLAATTAGPRDETDERSADPKVARSRIADAPSLLVACHAAFADGRMKDAEAACIAARDANPESAEAQGLLAHALYNRGKRHEALAAAERAVRVDPKWADGYVIIGGVHQDAGELGDAKRAYDRYLELEPKGQYASDLRAIVGKLGGANP